MTSEYNDSQQTNEQPPIRNEFASKRIVKRDFWLIPAYAGFNMVLIIMLLSMTMRTLTYLFGPMPENQFERSLMSWGQIYTLIGQCLILLLFYLMHKKTIIPIAMQRFKDLKKHIILIIIVFVVMYLLLGVYGWFIELLPEKYQFDDTVNNKTIEQLFTIKWLWPILFLDIVIITPIVEELLFRHLIIHELGKKLTYGAMYVVSILVFAGLHVIHATSPFEIGPYIIMAIGFVVAYHFSGRNLATTITLHMANNFISFISIIIPFILGK
ncbi:CPBP family intramembrane metalloprotease [Staphylococcus sp. NRL 16/872]|uniref:CPBP family intramembrane glutamic endopeptidase n=1 Tax=Staphylococcus sp. NRL 16/872 TaxID=2930131 RepID=UPI001FB472EC|nr:MULTISPECIES: CPBP family intramembrane glutamic endopeptidase [unclassified Staphylococcus]MCJ1655614.1 CPBP family intramembrane metalloprotease [Staphylococcus sp. NRL 21/187]MCJ1661437.1 CPBP family intramembrane metalloprotease [Staphylococcus sp. NRL 18/288]WEN69821.1 CPBP family intramembrane metalloprotease [Staphylococcus sp. NRL 16/872]